MFFLSEDKENAFLEVLVSPLEMTPSEGSRLDKALRSEVEPSGWNEAVKREVYPPTL